MRWEENLFHEAKPSVSWHNEKVDVSTGLPPNLTRSSSDSAKVPTGDREALSGYNMDVAEG